MLIGNRYSEDQLYRGIKHYNKSPLLSEDLHEISDTIHMKNDYLLSNLYGSGFLNSPSIQLTGTGARLAEPAVLLLNGDIILIQTDEGKDLLSLTDLRNSTHNGDNIYLCIVGWYQHLDCSESTSFRRYGGVSNATIDCNLIDEELGVENTTRYQFRWSTALAYKSLCENPNDKSITYYDRDAKGELTGEKYTIITSKVSNTLRIAPTKREGDGREGYDYDFTYMVSDMYFLPILKFSYNKSTDTISNLVNVKPLKPKRATGEVITSKDMPTDSIDNGTLWYNPDTQIFKIYVEGTGYVETGIRTNLVHFSDTKKIKGSRTLGIPSDWNYSAAAGDILQISYEGLSLIEGEHYTIKPGAIDLASDFEIEEGDSVTFNLIRLTIISDSIESIPVTVIDEEVI